MARAQINKVFFASFCSQKKCFLPASDIPGRVYELFQQTVWSCRCGPVFLLAVIPVADFRSLINGIADAVGGLAVGGPDA